MEPTSSSPSTLSRANALYRSVQGDQLGVLKRRDVMSVDEVRWWLKELLERQGWRNCSLTRTLGLGQHVKRRDGPGERWIYTQVRKKMDGRSWIHPHERVRMSKQLERIISGELAQIGSGVKGDSYRGAIADTPRPIRLPLKWHINLKRRDPLEWRQSGPPPPMLPNFRNMLLNPKPWDGDWRKFDTPTKLQRKYYGPWKA